MRACTDFPNRLPTHEHTLLGIFWDIATIPFLSYLQKQSLAKLYSLWDAILQPRLDRIQ